MIAAESTRQQLDPAATFGAYRSTVTLALFAVVWAAIETITTGDSAERPGLTVASLVILMASAVWLLRAAHPLRAPFRRRSMVVVYALAVIAVVLSTTATFGVDSYLADDWGPVVIAVLTIGITPYRPAREMFVAFAIVGGFLGVVSMVKVPNLLGDGPGLAFVVAGLAPTLAVSVAAIQYSRYLVEGLQSWHRRADVGAASLANDMAGGVATSVERERLVILSRDVAPFFTGLLLRDTVRDSDRERARSIAESMRTVMVADANRTWLTVAFSPTVRGDSFLVIDDPDFLAGGMIARQRTALRAVLVAAIDDERLERAQLTIRAEGTIGAVSLELMTNGYPPPKIAAEYAAYLSVLRVVFVACHVDVGEETVNVRFNYDCS